MAADLYWTNIDSLSSHYGNIVSAEKLLPTVGGGVQSDFLLRLARIRAQGDKHFAEFFRAKLKSRACIRK
jgi:hypothetical protein